MMRDAAPDDFGAIAALNHAWVHALSPLDAAELERLHQQAAYHRVADVQGTIAGFLLALDQDGDYQSPNFTWFARRYPQFMYIDRVVIATPFQGQGIGERVYLDLIEFARTAGHSTLTCEFDLHPPNIASRRFHERLGFVEVGREWIRDGKKQVSMQVRAL